jgi:hypothetical protein
MAGPSRQAVRTVKEQVEDELLGHANVTGVDIGPKIKGGVDTGELSIVVYVDKKRKTIAAKDRIPETVKGIKTDVQEEVIVLHPAMVRLADEELMVDPAEYATLEGGMSIGPCRAIYLEPPDVPAPGNYIFVGTLGAIVRDKANSAAMMLTNFHVACVTDTWAVGDDITQPSRVDGGACPSDTVGEITRAVLSENVDGAVLSLNGDRPFQCSILEIGEVKGTAAAALGMAVRKRGRTTGLTYGSVTSADYTTTIDYGDGLGSHTLKHQIRIAVDSAKSTQFGNSGDSGSVVVDNNNNVIGLYFAGTTTGAIGVANPIAAVLSELDIEVCSPKELLKDNLKEFPFEHKWWVKEIVKEWKEYALEKFDWESVAFPPDWLVRPPFGPPPGRPPAPGATPFIGRELRPDLRRGALAFEPDVKHRPVR